MKEGSAPPGARDPRVPDRPGGNIPWGFNIRDTVLNDPDDPGHDQEKLEHTFRQFDLMMFLLRNVSFQELFGDSILSYVEKLEESVARAPRRFLSDRQKGVVLAEIDGLKNDLASHAGLTLADLYTAAAPGGVADRFRNMRAAVQNVPCFPFLAFQDAGEYSDFDFGTFLERLGGNTYTDLFRESRQEFSPEALALVLAAKRAGVLETLEHRLQPDPVPNNFCCGGPGCEWREGSFCNQDDQGNCTAASDPCPANDP